MGADYRASASVRLVADDSNALVVPDDLARLGEFNNARTVWVHDVQLSAAKTLEAQLSETERFLGWQHDSLAKASGLVNVFAGWSPDTKEEVRLELALLDAVHALDGDLVIDVYNSDPRFTDEDEERRYWSRLRLANQSVNGACNDVLLDGESRRTGDLTSEWLRVLLQQPPSPSTRAGQQVVLEWIPADQDGVVLSRPLIAELVRRRLDFVIRANDPVVSV